MTNRFAKERLQFSIETSSFYFIPTPFRREDRACLPEESCSRTIFLVRPSSRDTVGDYFLSYFFGRNLAVRGLPFLYLDVCIVASFIANAMGIALKTAVKPIPRHNHLLHDEFVPNVTIRNINVSKFTIVRPSTSIHFTARNLRLNVFASSLSSCDVSIRFGSVLDVVNNPPAELIVDLLFITVICSFVFVGSIVFASFSSIERFDRSFFLPAISVTDRKVRLRDHIRDTESFYRFPENTFFRTIFT